MWEYDPECKLCQQTQRVETKHEDEAKALLLRRVDGIASKHHLKRAFILEDLNYWSLLPQVRAMLSAEGICPNCGHEFDAERDVQLDHREPPRPELRPDLARLHARNVAVLCGSCNNAKGCKRYAMWLDEEEEARLSANALQQEDKAAELEAERQMTIDDFFNQPPD